MAKPSLEGLAPEQIEELADTLTKLYNNPETRGVVLRATKKVTPGLVVPELELEERANAAFKQRDDKIESLEHEIRKRDAENRIDRERQGLREAGHSKEDIAAIEKLMMDKRIPDYGTAAQFFSQERKLAEPTPATSSFGQPPTISLPGDPLKALKQGPKGLRDFGRTQASDAINDLRSGKVKLVH